ncbi:MAG: cytochrome c3 family protein [Rhodospirillaceae bacterium]|nr:cytochrome c3 family protein [Rhodospirillaceae bacterium]MBL6929996.1 cytochrome c3 family protein [Rhodospirillales bacterium]MBL6941077.1 cytochrome c3 family protein [Rhodospirillales bacterium]
MKVEAKTCHEQTHRPLFTWTRMWAVLVLAGLLGGLSLSGSSSAGELMAPPRVHTPPGAADSADEPLGPFPGVVAPEGTYEGKNVEQPIEFPHDLHADTNKINCLYCHTYARRSAVAGIPPTSKCMGCHNVIATDRPRIKKLTEYWEKGESPPWKKVHDLPDYVRFTHERHLKKFLFDNPDMSVERVDEVCALCHGNVKKMTVARKQKPLTMGFCTRCHEANDGPFDCQKCHK